MKFKQHIAVMLLLCIMISMSSCERLKQYFEAIRTEKPINKTTEDLLYEKALRQVGQNDEIESLVQDYRRSLYIHEYEQQWLNKNMPQTLNEDTLKIIYEQNKSHFLLEDDLLKGILLILPIGAPNQDKLAMWMNSPNEKNLEKIEKYAFQYASGYQLFLDDWVPQSEIKKYTMENDSTHTSVLHVTERIKTGEPMPYEFAHSQLEQYLLEKRKHEYIQKFYNNVIKEKR